MVGGEEGAGAKGWVVGGEGGANVAVNVNCTEPSERTVFTSFEFVVFSIVSFILEAVSFSELTLCWLLGSTVSLTLCWLGPTVSLTLALLTLFVFVA